MKCDTKLNFFSLEQYYKLKKKSYLFSHLIELTKICMRFEIYSSKTCSCFNKNENNFYFQLLFALIKTQKSNWFACQGLIHLICIEV